MEKLLKVSLQYLLPQHLLSRLMFSLARWRWRPWKNLFIRGFISTYKVDMNIAEHQDADSYRHFNAFFTRALKPGCRPVAADPDTLVSPVDGSISAAGRINGDSIFQAKGLDYSLAELLGDDPALVNTFTDGNFLTLYLSPRDYHRIHMPYSGSLQKMNYLPGRLFSVNDASVAGIERLFARNERLITVFNTAAGTICLVLVGAIFVGSMETVWHGQVTPAAGGGAFTRDYSGNNPPVLLDKGTEMGRFNMGSTVIMLTGKERIDWINGLETGRWIALGSAVARRKPD